MLPRYFTSSSTNSSCSRLRRPIQPRLKRPSITTPLSGHSSRVTINSPPLTGSRVINGYIRSSSTAKSLSLVPASLSINLAFFITAMVIIANKQRFVNRYGKINHYPGKICYFSVSGVGQNCFQTRRDRPLFHHHPPPEPG